MEEKRRKVRHIDQLLPTEQKWLAKAVITIILADNRIEDSQVAFMKNLSKVFMDEKPRVTITEISKSLKDKKLPEIEELQVDDPEHVIFMLNTLVTSIFANENKLPGEVKNYFKAGLKLGVTHEVLMLKLTYQKERFRIKMAQKEVDETIRNIIKQRKEKAAKKI